MTLVWHWPQIVMVTWLAVEVSMLTFVCAAVAKNAGKPREPSTFGSRDIALLAFIWITRLAMGAALYFGGFFAGASP